MVDSFSNEELNSKEELSPANHQIYYISYEIISD